MGSQFLVGASVFLSVKWGFFSPSSISGLLVPVFNSASCLPYQWRTGWARGNISILTSILTPLGGVGFRAGLEAKFSCSVTMLSKAKKKKCIYCHGDHTANLKIRLSGQDGFFHLFFRFGLCHCAACGILGLGFSPCLRTWPWECGALPAGPPGNSPWIVSS